MSAPLLYNPSRSSIAELEATFVGRAAQLEALVRDLHADTSGKTRRQWLLVAPRGCGKSHFTTLVAERLRREHGWEIVRMPEEHYQVASVADLLEQIVAHLNGGQSPFADERDLIRVEERALDWLRSRTRTTGRPLLVVLENLGMLFERQLRDRRSQARLRQILSVDPPFTVLATATGYVAATTSHNAPFYDFFQHATLQDLSPEDARELVRARLVWDGPGGPAWSDVEPRVDALYHFAGGSPRLLLLLYAILREGVSSELHAQLMKLLDEVSPYYQARLKDISAQMERVLVELAIAGGPRTPSEIAHTCRLPVNVVTANLSKLQDERFVQPAARKDGRSRRYDLTDRLFRIWLQMREAPDGGQRLRFLVEFYRRWYASEELGRLMSEAAEHFWSAAVEGRDLRCGDHLLQMDYLADAAHGDRAFYELVELLERGSGQAVDGQEMGEVFQRVRAGVKDSRDRALLDCVQASWLTRQDRGAEAMALLEVALPVATADTVERLALQTYRTGSQVEEPGELMDRLVELVRAFPEVPLLHLYASWSARDAGEHEAALGWFNGYEAAGGCPHCLGWHACDLAIQLTLESQPAWWVISKVLQWERVKTPDCAREWEVAHGLIAYRQGQGVGRMLDGLGAWTHEPVPMWIVRGACCCVAHWGAAADAEPIMRFALQHEPPLSSIDNIDHLVEILMRSGRLSADLMSWLVDQGDHALVHEIYMSLAPTLSRRSVTNVLSAYVLLRDAGLLPDDLPPYASALRVQENPRVREELSPEEVEAVDLLLGASTS